MKRASRLFRSKAGVATIEYCLLASLIALGAFAALPGTGRAVLTSYEDTEEAVVEATGSAKGKPEKTGKPEKPDKPPKK